MSVIDTFDQIVNVYGTREAVVLESGHSISYTNLNDAAGDLAMVIVSHISTSEIEDENMLVGIMVQRHIGLIVSILGVLKSGAAYVPVDPSFPPDRQSYIFTHSKSKLLIADEHAWSQAIHLGISLPPVIIINENGVVIRSHLQHAYMKRHISIARLMEESRQRALHQIDGGLMYVLYTSGSTGKPKGVMVTNLSVANVVDYFAIELKVSPDSRVLCLTTVCFDISVIEIFMPLTRGAALVLIKSETQRDPFRILEVVREQQVSVVQATPTTFEMLLATGWSGDASVDFLVYIFIYLQSGCVNVEYIDR
jgi:non-ribosomal peptide synthetase component F